MSPLENIKNFFHSTDVIGFWSYFLLQLLLHSLILFVFRELPGQICFKEEFSHLFKCNQRTCLLSAFSLLSFPCFLQGFINRERDASFFMGLPCTSGNGEVLLRTMVCDCVTVRTDWRLELSLGKRSDLPRRKCVWFSCLCRKNSCKALETHKAPEVAVY